MVKGFRRPPTAASPGPTLPVAATAAAASTA